MRYIDILRLHDRDVNPDRDLAAAILSAGLSADFWQAWQLGLGYLINGTRHERRWHLDLGPVEIYLPNTAIFRLARGYFARNNISLGVADGGPIFTLEYGTGWRFLGGDIREQEFGLRIDRLEPVDGLRFSAGAYMVFDGSDASGYGFSGQVSYRVTDLVSLYVDGGFDSNPITRRPGFPEESWQAGVGIAIQGPE